LVQRLTKTIQRRGGYVLKTHGSSLQQGNPDLIVSYPCRDFALFVAIEVKKPGGTPSQLQVRRLTEIRRSGALALWGDDHDTIMATIQERVDEVCT
jgi:hypothetical protein